MTIKQALTTLSGEGVVASRRGVPAEVLAMPSGQQPVTVAERLARVEDVITLLEERVAALEDHDSHSTERSRQQP